ncbi:thioredoxin family protein [Thermosediminibacter litoriperuensis]|uniref:Thioredoxin-like protein n=1 Tax=Thermosediminibacter litoriperuensis TaxID=291989 RepID=A0A5S5AXB0_9FIRM|nr:thioredoxin family protein [Thermosediminibacter litoriperuensis]TYP58507.1 thioredoxin-like protein [Thermosediminibacter litoriperuensis]
MLIRELYEKGIKYSEFLEKADQKYRREFEKCYEDIKLSEKTLERIEKIAKKVRVLVFAEPWCPDCIVSLPVLVKITEINGLIDFTILPREGYEDFLENYKYEGKPRIPTFIFMNEEFEELGAFVEIPQMLKDIYARGYQPDIIVARRDYRQGKYAEVIAGDFLEIIEGSKRTEDGEG